MEIDITERLDLEEDCKKLIEFTNKPQRRIKIENIPICGLSLYIPGKINPVRSEDRFCKHLGQPLIIPEENYGYFTCEYVPKKNNS